MQWQVRDNGGALYVDEDGDTCATDGDIDIATALFLAASRWPHGSHMFPAGAYTYEAAALSDALLRHCIHVELNTPLLGDWANCDDKKNRRLYDATRSSDFILSSFLLFHMKHPDASSRARWQQVLEATLEAALSQLNHSSTGLIADFLEHDKRKGWVPASGKLLESKCDGEMSWNACRTRTSLLTSLAPRALLRRVRRPAHPATAAGDAPHACRTQLPGGAGGPAHPRRQAACGLLWCVVTNRPRVHRACGLPRVRARRQRIAPRGHTRPR